MNILKPKPYPTKRYQSKLDQTMAKPELTATGDLQHFIGVKDYPKPS